MLVPLRHFRRQLVCLQTLEEFVYHRIFEGLLHQVVFGLLLLDRQLTMNFIVEHAGWSIRNYTFDFEFE